MSSPNNLNFLPDDYLKAKRERRTNIICTALFVLVMGSISSGFVVSQRMTSKLQQQHDQINQQYTDAARRIAQVQQMQEKQKRMAAQAALTSSLLEKIPRSTLLADVTNCMPEGVSLLDMSLDSRQVVVQKPVAKTTFDQQKEKIEESKKAPPPPEPKMYEVTIKMTGVAVTDVQVAQFMARLGQSKLLKDVNLVVSEEFTDQQRKLRKFQVESTLRQESKK